MTQKKVIDAYKALQRLSVQPMPIKIAYALHKMRKALNPAMDFQVEQERALLNELQPELIDNGARYKFKTLEDAEQWVARTNELGEMETDIEIQPVEVIMTDDISISPDDIDALAGFVEFKEG